VAPFFSSSALPARNHWQAEASNFHLSSLAGSSSGIARWTAGRRLVWLAGGRPARESGNFSQAGREKVTNLVTRFAGNGWNNNHDSIASARAYSWKQWRANTCPEKCFMLLIQRGSSRSGTDSLRLVCCCLLIACHMRAHCVSTRLDRAPSGGRQRAGNECSK